MSAKHTHGNMTSKMLAFPLSFAILLLYYGYVCDAQYTWGQFPQLLTENQHERSVFNTENQKLTQGIFRIVEVHNRMACVHQCTRTADSCTSVNFNKQATNGLHSCELLTSDMDDQPEALQHDQEFDHIKIQLPIFSSCHEIQQNKATTNGVYSISSSPSHPIQVYCDMGTSGGGWTVIQKRIDGSVNFYRDWADYKRGFGNKLGEYWLGLDNIHRMTSQRSYRLRVDMEDFEGNTRYAEYGLFKVADESDNYRLTVGQYSGTAGDSLIYHNGMQFSTKDRDHDAATTRSCALLYPSGWWHNDCHRCNPNGLYLGGAGSEFSKGVTWFTWKAHDYSLKTMEFKIKPSS